MSTPSPGVYWSIMGRRYLLNVFTALRNGVLTGDSFRGITISALKPISEASLTG